MLNTHPARLAILAVWSAALIGSAAQGSAQSGPTQGLGPAQSLETLQGAAPVPMDHTRLAAEYRRAQEVQRIVSPEPPTLVAGRSDTFWILRQSPVEHFQTRAPLRLVGRHAYWYVEDGFSVAESSLLRAAEAFDRWIYPEVRRLVGSEVFPGLDNDPRVTIFNGNLPGLAGYVSSADAYPRSIHPFSNEREMVYLNIRATELSSAEYLSVLAHEFTHLVHGNVHRSEDTWIKEGLADLVAALVIPERAMSAGALMAAPDTQLNSWSLPPAAAHYQAGSWFLGYFVDRYGEEALYHLLARDTRGPQSVDAFLREAGSGMTFVDLFGDWVVANLVGDRTGPVVSYRSAPPPSPQPRRLRAWEAVQDTVAQFGVDSYELPPGARSFVFQGAPLVPVIGATPASGDAMWYGGRADTSVASIERAFDLSGLAQANLDYRVWFDIEPDYDFAYVSASTDGGRTWALLTTPTMSRANPTGNNLGVGYTGRSGAGAQPEWMEQSVDLSPFVGSVVWIRFSYVTDDAFVGEGIALDDIRISALGYFDGAEERDDGWTVRGFARVGRALPQSWLVQVVEITGGSFDVARIEVDGAGRAEWRGSPSADRVVVALSATTPVTTQRASYSIFAGG